MEASQHSLLAACFTLHSIKATLAIVPQRGAALWKNTPYIQPNNQYAPQENPGSLTDNDAIYLKISLILLTYRRISSTRNCHIKRFECQKKKESLILII
jgi:hypothetical protein